MLKPVLFANAASCLGFGVLFAAFPGGVASFLGTPPQILVMLLGFGLILNGAHILWVARQAAPKRRDVLYFALGDGMWVLATVILLAGGIWITSGAGVSAALVVAIWVGGCGLLQWRYAPLT